MKHIVNMLVSEELLANILKIDDVGRIVDASLSEGAFGRPSWVVLDIETEHGPEDAIAIEPVYETHEGRPVRVGIRWQLSDHTWQDVASENIRYPPDLPPYEPDTRLIGGTSA